MKNTRDKKYQRLESAREMRRNPTFAEDVLWSALRGRQLAGLKFRRQFVIGPLIADFYCAAARLVIEIDGEIHDYKINYDATRTLRLEEYGYQVIRFTNEQVLNELGNVLTQIKMFAFNRISNISINRGQSESILTPNPSPDSGRGESALVPTFSPDPGQNGSPTPLELGEGVGGEVELSASLPPKVLNRSTV